jgi:hypothetical protein
VPKMVCGRPLTSRFLGRSRPLNRRLRELRSGPFRVASSTRIGFARSLGAATGARRLVPPACGGGAARHRRAGDHRVRERRWMSVRPRWSAVQVPVRAAGGCRRFARSRYDRALLRPTGLGVTRLVMEGPATPRGRRSICRRRGVRADHSHRREPRPGLRHGARIA